MRRLEEISGGALYHEAMWDELINRRIDERADGVFAIRNAPMATPARGVTLVTPPS